MTQIPQEIAVPIAIGSFILSLAGLCISSLALLTNYRRGLVRLEVIPSIQYPIGAHDDMTPRLSIVVRNPGSVAANLTNAGFMHGGHILWWKRHKGMFEMTAPINRLYERIHFPIELPPDSEIVLIALPGVEKEILASCCAYVRTGAHRRFLGTSPLFRHVMQTGSIPPFERDNRAAIPAFVGRHLLSG